MNCRHCGRSLLFQDGEGWYDPEATGDDSIWREVCGDNHTERAAPHEPEAAWFKNDLAERGGEGEDGYLWINFGALRYSEYICDPMEALVLADWLDDIRGGGNHDDTDLIRQLCKEILNP